MQVYTVRTARRPISPTVNAIVGIKYARVNVSCRTHEEDNGRQNDDNDDDGNDPHIGGRGHRPHSRGNVGCEGSSRCH